jgi:putative SOS response-associated peptidase YedK
MCNLYSELKGQEAIRQFARTLRDITGNLPPMPGIFPDQFAPVVRNAPDGVRELAMLRWGMPPSPQSRGQPVTNIRSPNAPHWRGWLKPGNRCVVPFTSFCEYAGDKPPKVPTWFAFSADRPLAFFAGLWTAWRGTRGPKSRPEEGEHQVFGLLTTKANKEVAAIHPRAMPVILTSQDEIEQWMTADAPQALKLQRPLPDGALKIVMTGEKEDKGE